MKYLIKKIICFIVGHSLKNVTVMQTSNGKDDRYFYVGHYIRFQLEGTVQAHQCKRCHQYILKNESPEYC